MRRKPLVATVLVGALLGAVWTGLVPLTAGAATEGAPSNRGWTTSIEHEADNRTDSDIRIGDNRDEAR